MDIEQRRRWMAMLARAPLDAANRNAVVQFIIEARRRGAAIVGIFHDAARRGAVADREFALAPAVA